VLKKSLSVRQTEELVSFLQNKTPAQKGEQKKGIGPLTQDAQVADLVNKLQEKFGTKVQVQYRGGKGHIEIKFFNDDDLNRILEIAGIKLD